MDAAQRRTETSLCTDPDF